MNEPLVSVIVPFYNRIDSTLRAIESIYEQTYSHIEVIIVNDGSTVDDASIVSTIENINLSIYVKLPENKGPSVARNAGVKAASGKYIAFLDSDDCWVNNKLEYQVKLMEENGWNISHTSYYRTNTLLDNTKIIRSGRFSFIFPFLAFHCPIATPTVMVNKNLLSLHSFKPELRYGEDVLLWLEISKKYKGYGINIPLSIVNTGENTASNNNEIQKDVFKMLTNNGFNGHPFLSFFHFIYRKFRTIF